jgi:hypothetical protein
MDTLVTLAQIALPILTGLGGAVVVVYIRRGLSAIVTMRVATRRVSGHANLVVLAFEIQNLSTIRVVKERIALRVREFDPETGLDGQDAVCRGDEWVTLRSPWVPERREVGAHCSVGPCEVFESTVFLNPGEILHTERVYEIGESGFLHVGLQLRNRYAWWVEQLDRITRWWNWRSPVNLQSGLSRQQTTTWYICP